MDHALITKALEVGLKLAEEQVTELLLRATAYSPQALEKARQNPIWRQRMEDRQTLRNALKEVRLHARIDGAMGVEPTPSMFTHGGAPDDPDRDDC